MIKKNTFLTEKTTVQLFGFKQIFLLATFLISATQMIAQTTTIPQVSFSQKTSAATSTQTIYVDPLINS